MTPHRSILSASLLSLLLLTWASTAAAVPVLEVTSDTNPVVEGVVQVLPGDNNVQLTFGIVPDANSVTDWELAFNASAEVIVNFCTGVEGLSLWSCVGGFDYRNRSDEGILPQGDPFAIGTALISVNNNAALGPALTANQFSFINSSGAPPTDIGGQVVATVVPEPSTALLLGLGLVGMGVRRRAIASS